jgi:hypothetical protein
VLDHRKDVHLGAVEQVGCEEVQRQDPLRLRLQELGPLRAVPAGCRVDPGVLEDLPDRSPWIRRYPHDSFPPAIPSTTDRTARRTGGRPEQPCRDSRAQRRRTMSRCQRKIVAGVTISRNLARRPAGSVPASSASHARSGHVNRE